MRPTRRRLPRLALLPLLLAAACGSPPPLPKVDACALLTKDDAQAITGVPMVAALGANALTGGQKTDPGECVYTAVKKDDQRRLGLSIQAFADREEAAHVFELTANALPGFGGQPPQPVPGLADRALWSGGQLNKLYVLRGRFRLIVGSMAVENDVALAAAKAATTRVLARLPG